MYRRKKEQEDYDDFIDEATVTGTFSFCWCIFSNDPFMYLMLLLTPNCCCSSTHVLLLTPQPLLLRLLLLLTRKQWFGKAVTVVAVQPDSVRFSDVPHTTPLHIIIITTVLFPPLVYLHFVSHSSFQQTGTRQDQPQ